jgi:hypothetical protein
MLAAIHAAGYTTSASKATPDTELGCHATAGQAQASPHLTQIRR